jgi:hypothetical protein
MLGLGLKKYKGCANIPAKMIRSGHFVVFLLAFITELFSAEKIIYCISE